MECVTGQTSNLDTIPSTARINKKNSTATNTQEHFDTHQKHLKTTTHTHFVRP